MLDIYYWLHPLHTTYIFLAELKCSRPGFLSFPFSADSFKGSLLDVSFFTHLLTRSLCDNLLQNKAIDFDNGLSN